MDSNQIIRELDLAAYEMAAAEAHERAAKTLRLSAIRRTAAIQAEIKATAEAVKRARRSRAANEEA